MIDISRDGTNLLVRLQADWEAANSLFVLRWNAGSEWAASLLQWNLTKSLSSLMQQIRCRAYNHGWKDAKAHRAKRTDFSGRLGDE